MKADTLTLKALFQRDIRYVIPTFQRPYVWTQEDQWEALWNDIRNVAEWYLDELEAADGNNALAEERSTTHFMGAVVLQQQPTASREIETRTVIDGQQRLTTMQLVLDAAQEVMEELEFPEAPRLSRLVVNDHAEGDDVFKLWPSTLDQEAFRAAMTNGAVTSGAFEESLIAEAHDFFRLQIREWIEAAPSPEEGSRRAHGLETALYGLLVMVVIDLATVDDPFVIFETLNARGTPLLDSDLIKNYVLQTASMRGAQVDDLYHREWKPLEDPWWRTEIPTGRLYRPRVDVFLNYWLVMRTATEVLSSEVFPRFKAYVEDEHLAIDAVAADVRSIGATYRGLEEIDAFTVAGTFLYRWRTIEAGVSTPILLWLFSQPTFGLNDPRLERSLKALESFLVRRMLCRMTTKNYNELFLELLSRLITNGSEHADDVLVGYLSEQTADSRLWPDDGAFELALLDMPLYRLLTRGRLRMVLEALEDKARSPLADESHVQRGCLTIEHVLPQKWRDHWPLRTTEDELEAAALRDRALHSIGNLTLVNGRLNPALSNGDWETKRGLLAEHLVLHLNKDLVNGYADRDWDETTIRERGKLLAERAISVWPSGQKA